MTAPHSSAPTLVTTAVWHDIIYVIVVIENPTDSHKTPMRHLGSGGFQCFPVTLASVEPCLLIFIVFENII